LTWAPRLGRLINWVYANEAPVLIEGVPVLAMDLHGDAYGADFGDDAAAYIDAVFDNLHWGRPNRRYATALAGACHQTVLNDFYISAEAYRAWAQEQPAHLLLDICLAEDRAKRHDKLPGAQVAPPETLDTWIETLPTDKPIIAYCVYGYQVSGNAVQAMRDRGLDARSLAGGIAAWHAIDGPTEPLDS